MSGTISKEMPTATLATLQGRYPCIRHLITIDSTPPVYWADGPLFETDGVNTFTPRDFKVSDITWGKLDQAGAKIIIDNRDSAVSDISYSQYLTTLTLTVGILVKDNWEDEWNAVYEPITAKISDASGTASTATLLLQGLNGFQHRSILKQGDIYCRHIYGPDGGLRCQYSGAELTCDRTRATCKARGNLLHFGGFSWAPQPGELIQIAPATSQQVPGSGSSSIYIPAPPGTNNEEDYTPLVNGFGVGPDAVSDGVIELQPIAGGVGPGAEGA